MKISFHTLVGAFIAMVAVGVIGLAVAAIVQEIQEPDAGIITAKKHQSEWTSIQCHTVGKATICTPYTNPECWEIDYEEDGHEGDACVPAEAWTRYEIGGRYP
jgi:hypothetical protein